MKSGEYLLNYYEERNWKVKDFNICYIEDAHADTWEPLPEELDAWNDVRVVFDDKGEVLLSCVATTEPGGYYTTHPLNPGGTFRINLEDYFKDAWELGYHVTRASNQRALIQVEEVRGKRDANKDGLRSRDAEMGGLFGINQHTTANSSAGDSPLKIGQWSAGCLVGRTPSTHYEKFIPLCEASGYKLFSTVVIDGDKFAKFRKGACD